jgi:dihydrofolate reductase
VGKQIVAERFAGHALLDRRAQYSASQSVEPALTRSGVLDRGEWGYNPPYNHPVFVLTQHAREPLEMKGGTTFHFVTEGIESAVAQATDAAQGRTSGLLEARR